MFAYPVTTWIFGPWDLFIEHGHRLLGSLAGLVTIGLLVAAVSKDKRYWFVIASGTALLLVISQGILGGVRVLAVDRQIAKLHGCIGPAFFAFSFALIVFASTYWRQIAERMGDAPEIFEKFSSSRIRLLLVWKTTLLCYLQLVVGAHIRHVDVASPPSFFVLLVSVHILFAVAILVHGFAIAYFFQKPEYKDLGLRTPAMLMTGLIVVQFLLGLGTWLVKWGTPSFIADANILYGFTIVDKGMFPAPQNP